MGSDNNSSGKSLLKLAFRRGLDWDKDDLLTVVFWARQLVGILFGLAWGLARIEGAAGIIAFFFANAFIVYIYYTKYLQVDEESMGKWDLLSEGFLPSLGLFVLVWTIFTTSRYEEAAAPSMK